MRRVIAIVLLIASIPLQFAWAEAHAYCEHPEGPDAIHIGYHYHDHSEDHGHSHTHAGHTHAVDSNDLSGIDTDQVKDFHTDCGFCHTGSMAALSDLFSLPTFDLDQRQQTYLSFSERDAPFARPERPQWIYLA